eukprot:Protomagalhaensia_wolfi_Nauph_80__2138@NODE_2374_length_1111_cov_80_827425_g1860_i0_p1_GENE_NODE_2374_length_1111_cov_80_827425_g1860_i0NODE_2374_length_1111_cov_80_827425_g1860_i0_p1_ORF_typecomplete_len197_score14_49zfCCHC/PF00098_23/0_0023Gmx_para_CXXCG/PF09535_10/0_15_NODE_2374_length_1111_cov_80_827425_g1860_i0213803
MQCWGQLGHFQKDCPTKDTNIECVSCGSRYHLLPVDKAGGTETLEMTIDPLQRILGRKRDSTKKAVNTERQKKLVEAAGAEMNLNPTQQIPMDVNEVKHTDYPSRTHGHLERHLIVEGSINAMMTLDEGACATMTAAPYKVNRVWLSHPTLVELGGKVLKIVFHVAETLLSIGSQTDMAQKRVWLEEKGQRRGKGH